MEKTMTDNVINEFKKAFSEAGLTWNRIRVGEFKDAGIECLIPNLWWFDTDISEKDFIRLNIDGIIYRVLNELGILIECESNFDTLCTTIGDWALAHTTEEI